MADSLDAVDPEQLEALHIQLGRPEDELADQTRPLPEQPWRLGYRTTVIDWVATWSPASSR